MRLLLSLGVRKMELLGAKWAEFDLGAGVWNLPALRSKNALAVRIPLPPAAVERLQRLETLACGSAYLFPRRAFRDSKDSHMAQATLNQALHTLNHGLEGFTVHDFRRTVRIQLAALDIPPHIAERCLNHKITGVAGVYDRYDYLEERKAALAQWALVLAGLDNPGKVVPIRKTGAPGRQ